jgi:GNAT superfamily N-acetyltransferase
VQLCHIVHPDQTRSGLIRPDQLRQFCALPGSAALQPELPSMRQADAHWAVCDEQSQILARCSLWWTNVPPHSAQRLGLIGHYAAYNDQAARVLIDHACAQLAAYQCTMVVGPMDGNTFRHYRFVTEQSVGGDAHPTYFLEPENPDDWPSHFLARGFEPLAHYFSAVGTLPEEDSRSALASSRIAGKGIRIRSVDLDVFENELQRIYDLVTRSFQGNFLYSPIARAEFVAQYMPIREHIEPQLVLIAEQHDVPVGFIFAIPDLAQAQRGEPIDAIVIKTVAVTPELGGIGLGSLLVSRCQTAARNLGYKRAIHALMFEDNLSLKISAHYAQLMRRYTLFSKQLAGTPHATS